MEKKRVDGELTPQKSGSAPVRKKLSPFAKKNGKWPGKVAYRWAESSCGQKTRKNVDKRVLDLN